MRGNKFGINGFGKHRPVYFLGLAPQNPDEDFGNHSIYPETNT